MIAPIGTGKALITLPENAANDKKSLMFNDLRAKSLLSSLHARNDASYQVREIRE